MKPKTLKEEIAVYIAINRKTKEKLRALPVKQRLKAGIIIMVESLKVAAVGSVIPIGLLWLLLYLIVEEKIALTLTALVFLVAAIALGGLMVTIFLSIKMLPPRRILAIIEELEKKQ